MRKISVILNAMILAVGFCLSGCGGGGGGPSTATTSGGSYDGSTPARILNWAPPTLYTDSSPLNPAADLDVFEIYVKTEGNFSISDGAMAAVNALDSASGQVNTSFNLAGLRPFLADGVAYFVSVRAVAKNGLKSDFSQAASFSF